MGKREIVLTVYSRPISSVVPALVGLPFIGLGFSGLIFAEDYAVSASIILAGACLALYNATTVLTLDNKCLSLRRLFVRVWAIPLEDLAIYRRSGSLKGAYATYIFRNNRNLKDHSVLQSIFREADIDSLKNEVTAK